MSRAGRSASHTGRSYGLPIFFLQTLASVESICIPLNHETERRLAGEARKSLSAGPAYVGSAGGLLHLKPDFEMTELEIAIRQTHEKAYKVGYSVGLMHGQEMAWSGVSHLRALLAERGLNGDTVDAVALTEEIAKLKAELASKKDLTLDGALEKIAELRTKNNALYENQMSIVDTNKTVCAKLVKAEAEAEKLQSEIATLKDQLTTAASRINELEAELAKEQERSGSLLKSVENGARRIWDDEITISKLSGKVTHMSRFISHLESALKDANKHITDLGGEPAITITEADGLVALENQRKKWDAPAVPAQEPQPDGTEPLEYPDLLEGMVQPENSDLLAFGMRIEKGDLVLDQDGITCKTGRAGWAYDKASYQKGLVYARPRPLAPTGPINN